MLALARQHLAHTETSENTGFGRKCYEFLDFSKISKNVAFRSGGVANVMSFREMFQVTARARTPRYLGVPRFIPGTRDLRLIKARVLRNLPPGAPGGPEEGGERYRIICALRAQIIRCELKCMGFHVILEVAYVGSLQIGVGARVRGGGD